MMMVNGSWYKIVLSDIYDKKVAVSKILTEVPIEHGRDSLRLLQQ